MTQDERKNYRQEKVAGAKRAVRRDDRKKNNEKKGKREKNVCECPISGTQPTLNDSKVCRWEKVTEKIKIKISAECLSGNTQHVSPRFAEVQHVYRVLFGRCDALPRG
jgi:hypothetical protein